MLNKCSVVKYVLVTHLQSMPFLSGNTTRSSLLMLGNASYPTTAHKSHKMLVL